METGLKTSVACVVLILSQDSNEVLNRELQLRKSVEGGRGEVTYFTCEGTQNSHSMSQLETNLVFAEANRGENEPQIVFCRCGGYHAIVGPATRLPTRYFDTHAKIAKISSLPSFLCKVLQVLLDSLQVPQSPQNREHINTTQTKIYS